MMAKKSEPPKPIFPLKHEFYASLDHFIHEAGMLADAVKQAMDLGAVDKRVSPILAERLDAFEKARHGNE